jgi:hypothetical protein
MPGIWLSSATPRSYAGASRRSRTCHLVLDHLHYAPIAVVVVVILAVVTWQAWGKRTFMRGAQDEHMTKARDQVFEEH